MNRFITATTVALVAFASTAANAFDKPPFPRLGGIKISGPQNYEDPAYQADLAKLSVVVLQDFPGWEKAHGTTMQAVVSAIKAKNPKTLVFTYVNINEMEKSTTGAWAEVANKLTQNKWWLYPSGASGTPVTSTWGTGEFGITNYTTGALPDANGKRYLDWYPQWAYDKFFKNAPNLDGAFTDNFFWKPRVNGDWNRDGSLISAGSAATQKLHRQGMAKYIGVWRSVMPGKYQLGNMDYGDPSTTATEYDQLLEGGLLERAIGYSWSPEGQDYNGVKNSWGSWQLLMAEYRRLMASTKEPKLFIFMQYGNPTDYQAFRYGLTSCLMDDGYFDFAPKTYAGVPWFDEYNAKLGQATSKPSTAAWKQGVYRRDFENGIALVNPRGNGAQTIDLGGTFKRLSGKQDSTVNSGATVTKVTLKDRDGIILLRDKPVTKPLPPKMMTSATN